LDVVSSTGVTVVDEVESVVDMAKREGRRRL
jgi:hypothetical protein